MTHDSAHSYFTLMQTHNFSIQQIKKSMHLWMDDAPWHHGSCANQAETLAEELRTQVASQAGGSFRR